MATAENKARVREVIERVWNRGDEESLDSLFAPAFVLHDPNFSGDVAGVDALRRFVRAFRSAFPNLAITVEQQVAEDETVVTRWTARGTHLKELLGISPTGRQVLVTGMTSTRLTGGRIAESWVQWDMAGLLRQLGLLREIQEPHPATS